MSAPSGGRRVRRLHPRLNPPAGCLCVRPAGISFVPKEIGEHFVNIKKNGRHIPSSPISVMINQSEIGDASRVRVSGPGLNEARTFEPAEFIIDTREAGTRRAEEMLLSFPAIHIHRSYSLVSRTQATAA